MQMTLEVRKETENRELPRSPRPPEQKMIYPGKQAVRSTWHGQRQYRRFQCGLLKCTVYTGPWNRYINRLRWVTAPSDRCWQSFLGGQCPHFES